MANYGSKLGEAVGKLVESEIYELTKKICKPYELFVDFNGPRLEKRDGKKLLYINDTGNEYQIDIVVENGAGEPLILIESKYIRHKKHNRDKGSWTCVAHYKIRTTYPSVKKSIAVLLGNWSKPSKRLMNSFGIELIEIPFNHVVSVLNRYGVVFELDEKDTETPKKAWSKYLSLSEKDLEKIKKEIVRPIEKDYEDLLVRAIEYDPKELRKIEQVELLLKTDQGEFVVKKFSNPKEVFNYLSDLMSFDPSKFK